MTHSLTLPVTVVLAVKNEAVNIARCLDALAPAAQIVAVDSESTDETAKIAQTHGAEVVQFHFSGGYPKKRQWALDNLKLETAWTLLLDADEVVPQSLWAEIAQAVGDPNGADAYFITKGFHFLGKRFRFGGFSHSAILLFKTGKVRFERLIDEPAGGLDMEDHEPLILDRAIGTLPTPLGHQDEKRLEAYIDRHNKDST